MRNIPPEPGWWQASDGKWYAPELHPDYQPPPPTPCEPLVIEDDPDPVTWDFSDWNDDQLGKLASALLRERIPHLWEGRTLAVHPDYEGEVDEILDELCEGWWEADDGKWYAPELHPDYRPPAPQPPEWEPDADDTPLGGWLAVGGGVAMMIGSLLPWVSFTGALAFNRNGFQLGVNQTFSVDGGVMLFLGLVTAIIGIARLTKSNVPPFLARSSIVTAIGAGILVTIDYSSLHDLANRAHSVSGIEYGSIGIGYWVCVVGIVAAFLGGLVLRSAANSA